MKHKSDPLSTNSDEEETIYKHKKKQYNPTKTFKKKKKKIKDLSHVQTDLQGGDFEDEFDIYGKFIATQLRNMELPKALRTQLAIQNLINKARLSD